MMLSKAHLTSHSRMSGSRWVSPPSWLSGSTEHLKWLKFWIDFDGETSIKLQRQFTRDVWLARYLVLEKPALSSAASDFLPLDPLDTCSWTSSTQNSMWVIHILRLCMFSSWVETFPCLKADIFTVEKREKKSVGKCVSHLKYIFHNFQWSRHEIHRANHISLNENLVNVLESSGKVKRANWKTVFRQNTYY